MNAWYDFHKNLHIHVQIKPEFDLVNDLAYQIIN
ncbi:hypothetical protein J936_3958, partial [Acinetobacter baumannii 44362_3]